MVMVERTWVFRSGLMNNSVKLLSNLKTHLVKLKPLGTAQATGQTGKTAERFDVASLAAFGREQALRASNLTATIDKQKLDQD